MARAARPRSVPVPLAPTLRRQAFFWLGGAAVFILTLLLFSKILLPFVVGMALAFALDPIADWLERRGMSRIWATFTILVAFMVVVLIGLVLLVPVLIQQFGALIANLPTMAEQLQNLLTPLFNSTLFQRLGVDAEAIRQSLSGVLSQSATWAAAILASLWSGAGALFALVSLLVITPVVAFYMLYDWDRMIARVDSWLPREHAPVIRELAGEMTHAIAGFVRGQGLCCIILGAFYATGLGLIGLAYGLIVGLMAGILSFIPYVGSLVGFMVSIIIAVIQFWPEWEWIAATAAIFFAGQFLEGYILQPRLVGHSVGLHPVWLMFALLAFGSLFGFVGTLLAVPAAAAVAVLVRFALRRYLASPYYRGIIPAEQVGEEAATIEALPAERRAGE